MSITEFLNCLGCVGRLEQGVMSLVCVVADMNPFCVLIKQGAALSVRNNENHFHCFILILRDAVTDD